MWPTTFFGAKNTAHDVSANAEILIPMLACPHWQSGFNLQSAVH
jgi:hypothetical protein